MCLSWSLLRRGMVAFKAQVDSSFTGKTPFCLSQAARPRSRTRSATRSNLDDRQAVAGQDRTLRPAFQLPGCRLSISSLHSNLRPANQLSNWSGCFVLMYHEDRTHLGLVHLQKLVAHEDPGCGGRTESSTETQRVEG